jgi:hypothetical protein
MPIVLNDPAASGATRFGLGCVRSALAGSRLATSFQAVQAGQATSAGLVQGFQSGGSGLVGHSPIRSQRWRAGGVGCKSRFTGSWGGTPSSPR